MAVSQNTCYQVVNISWLKGLVGTSVQNSNGQTVSVSDASGDTYCPTYSQLTGGTFIPYRSVSSDGPASDVDGITVNKTCYATGQDYAANQLVDIHDMAVSNTRLNSFTVAIASASTNVDACGGGTRNLSYTRTFTRTTWDMLNCANSTASSASSTDVNDTRNSLITWDANNGTITASTTATSGKAVSIGKNKATSSTPSTRTITVSGSSTFRGTTTTETATVTQNAVTGGWVVNTQSEENVRANGVEATTDTSFACVGGTYGGRAKQIYDVRTYYVWKDNCSPAETYYDINYDKVEDADKDKTRTVSAKTGTFSDVTSTGYDAGSTSATLSWGSSYGSLTFTQTCANCNGSSCCCRSVKSNKGIGFFK